MIVESQKVPWLELHIVLDEVRIGNDPRDWDNLGVIATWHRRYQLGDVQPQITPEQYLASLPKGSIVLPVYMYAHSGLVLSTSPFSCPWDSGQLGVISCTPESGRKEFGRVWRKKATAALKAEVETYSLYVQGEVYGFRIEKDGKIWDACYGFLGFEHVEQEGHAALESAEGHFLSEVVANWQYVRNEV